LLISNYFYLASKPGISHYTKMKFLPTRPIGATLFLLYRNVTQIVDSWG